MPANKFDNHWTCIYTVNESNVTFDLNDWIHKLKSTLIAIAGIYRV